MHPICILSVLLVLVSISVGDEGGNCSSEIQQLQQKVSKLNKQVSLAYSKPIVPTTNCTLTHFEFPRQHQTEDFVWYRRHFPRLMSGTMCVWIKTTQIPEHTHFMSYATNKNANQFIIVLRNPTTLEVVIQDSYDGFEFPDPEKMNHVCVWFDSKRAVVGAYINGEELPSQGYPGYVVQGGGSLILGQEQDAVNAGGLDPDQCFSGTLDNFMIWPRVLSQVEVLRIGVLGQCPVDHAVVMTTDRVEMWGESLYSVPTECPLMDV